MKRLLIAVMMCALMLTTACATGSQSGNQKKLSQNSTQEEIADYLNAAMKLTAEEFENPADMFPDFSKLSNGAKETDIDLGIHTVGPELEYSFDQSMKLHLNAKTDLEADQISLTASILSDYFSFENYELYLSPSLVAIKAPDFFTAKPYLSVDPNTFVSDWNNSYFGQSNPLPFSEDADLNTLMDEVMGTAGIQGSFSDMLDNMTNASNSYNDAIVELMKQLENGISYSYDGKNITHVISADNMNAFIKELYGDIMPGMMNSMLTDMVPADEMYNMDDMLGVYEQMADMINIKNDVSLVYEFDEKGRVNAVRSNRIEMEVNDGYSETVVMGLAFDCQLSGAFLGDELLLKLTMDVEGESVQMDLSRNLVRGSDLRDKWTLAISAGEEVVTVTLDLYSNPDKDGENFSAKLSGNMDGTSFELELAGNLSQSKDEIALRDGRLDIRTDGVLQIGLTLDLIYRNIREVPVPAVEDTKGFFDLTTTELMDLLEALGMY